MCHNIDLTSETRVVHSDEEEFLEVKVVICTPRDEWLPYRRVVRVSPHTIAAWNNVRQLPTPTPKNLWHRFLLGEYLASVLLFVPLLAGVLAGILLLAALGDWGGEPGNKVRPILFLTTYLITSLGTLYPLSSTLLKRRQSILSEQQEYAVREKRDALTALLGAEGLCLPPEKVGTSLDETTEYLLLPREG